MRNRNRIWNLLKSEQGNFVGIIILGYLFWLALYTYIGHKWFITLDESNPLWYTSAMAGAVFGFIVGLASLAMLRDIEGLFMFNLILTPVAYYYMSGIDNIGIIPAIAGIPVVVGIIMTVVSSINSAKAKKAETAKENKNLRC